MSLLKKLSIRGIRSFTPKLTSTIEFHTPLTLIVGPNGSGKTTIIEALNFLTTGDLPPNSKNGAFIYNPKMNKSLDVRAEVKLDFVSNNIEYTVTKFIQLSSKRNKTVSDSLAKMEQRTNEVSLVCGKEIITEKLTELDKIMPEYFTSNKSLLHNVIFCHQEESGWPLGDPTILKKKLDDIFSSTNYIKAIAELKNSKKEMNADFKLKSNQLTFLYKDKCKRDDLILNEKSNVKLIESSNEKLNSFTSEIKSLVKLTDNYQSKLNLYKEIELNHNHLIKELNNNEEFVNNFTLEILNDNDLNKKLRKVNEEIKIMKENLSKIDLKKSEEDFKILEKQRNVYLNNKKNYDDLVNQLNYEKLSYKELLDCEYNNPTSINDEMNELTQFNKKMLGELYKKRDVLLENNVKIKMEINLINNYLRENQLIQRDDSFDVNKEVNIDRNFFENEKKIYNDLKIKENELMMKSNKLLKMNKQKDELVNKRRRFNELTEVINNFPTYDISLKDLITEKCHLEKEYYKLKETKNIAVIRNKESEIKLSKLKEKLFSIKSTILNKEKDFEELFEELNNLKFIESHSRNNLEETVKKINKDIDFQKGRKEIFTYFKEKLIDNKCVLCKKNLSEKEVVSINNLLNKSIKTLEGVISEKISMLENQNNLLNSLEINNEKINNENKNIEKIKEICNEIKEIKFVELDSATDEKLSSYEKKINECSVMIDLRKKEEFKLEGYLKEYKVLENIIDKSKENNSNDETIEDIELELDQVQEDIEIKKESLNSLQQEILEYEKYIQKRDSEIQNRKICDVKESYNKRLDEIKEMKIDSEIEMIKKEISDHESSYSKKITVLRVKYNETVNHTKQLNIKKEIIDELNHKLKIMNFSAECFDDHKFNEARMNFDILKDEFISISKKLEYKTEYSKLLEENIKLSKAYIEIKIIKEEIENFDMKEVHKLKQLLKECNLKLENASKAENVLTGEIKQLKLNSKKNQEELEMYKDAVFKYNECFLEMKYLEYAIMDIDKIITALDKSIVEFHSTKLLEINLCLKELWMNTYHGNEIDYIQLKSDLTSKTYNYRIVMYKEEVEMDMRGRCSAGQKMIASILIRLAIADAFCQSTIIALDEPTTNLDSENVESLATTLNTLSKERINFQIILITHDEDFVSILTRNGLDCYYKIDKTTNKGSQITKVNSY